MNLHDMLHHSGVRGRVAPTVWRVATVGNFRFRPGDNAAPAYLDADVHLSKTERILATIPITDDCAQLVAFLRACGEKTVADAVERGEHPSFDLDQIDGRKVKVQILNGVVVAFA